MQLRQLGWRLHPRDITVLPGSTAHSLYAPASPPLYLPPHASPPSACTPCDTAPGSEAFSSLALFQAAVLQSAVIQQQQRQQLSEQEQAEESGRGGRSAAVHVGEESGSKEQGRVDCPDEGDAEGPSDTSVAAADVIMYTGGLVWCTAFCPARPHVPAVGSTHAPQPQPQQQQQQQQAGQRPQGLKRKAFHPSRLTIVEADASVQQQGVGDGTRGPPLEGTPHCAQGGGDGGQEVSMPEHGGSERKPPHHLLEWSHDRPLNCSSGLQWALVGSSGSNCSSKGGAIALVKEEQLF